MADTKELSQMTHAELQEYASGQIKTPAGDSKTPEQIQAEADAEAAKIAAEGAKASVSEPDFKEMLGEGYEKLEDVRKKIPPILKEHKNLLDERSKWSEEKTKLAEEKTLLEKQIEALQTQFADESLYKVNELAKKTGRKDWDILAKVVTADTEKMQDIEVLILDKLYQNPKTDTAMLRKFLENKYGINSKPDPDATEDEKAKYAEELELAKYQLKEDAEKVRKELKKVGEEIKLPDKVDSAKIKEAEETKKKERQEAFDKTVVAWEGINKTFITSNMKTVPFMTKTKEGKEEKLLDYEIPSAEIDGYVKDVSKIMTEQGIPFAKESLEFAYDYVSARVFAEHKTDIVMAIAEKARSISDEEWIKLINNPSALINPGQKPGIQVAKNKEEEDKLRKSISNV